MTEPFSSLIFFFIVYRKRFESLIDARLALFHYIGVFYNSERLHDRWEYRSRKSSNPAMNVSVLLCRKCL